MGDLEDARARFKAISEGRYVPKALSVEEAKKRLREADPGMDISGSLQALRRNDTQKAAASVVLETLADPSVVSYWSPALIGLLLALMPAGESAPYPKTGEQGPDRS